MRFFISLSYDGSTFSGWQIQNNANSIQAELQNALSLLLKEPIQVIGAGRTDSGVNAINYIAHFDTTDTYSLLPNSEQATVDIINSRLMPDRYFQLPENAQKAKNFIYKINAILPREIAVNSIFLVDDNMHARFSAKKRTYKYFIHSVKNPFDYSYSYYCRDLDIAAMNKAAVLFVGEHDFASLQKAHSDVKTTICNVTEAFWSIQHPHIFNNGDELVFTVSANRFLRNMVRAMVGSLIEVGCGKKDPSWINDLIAARNRNIAGHSVPGNALFLTDIQY